MRALISAIGIALFVAVAFTSLSAQQPPQIVWSPKATKPGDWTPPHKPHTKIADLLAKHKGKADWVETVVDDDTLHADYIAAAPGSKTPRRMNADTRECLDFINCSRAHSAAMRFTVTLLETSECLPQWGREGRV